MALGPTLRRRTSRRGRLAAAVVVACAGGGTGALLLGAAHGSTVAIRPLVAEAQVCVSPIIKCPTGSAHPSSPPPPTSSGKPPPTSSGSRPTQRPQPSSSYSEPPGYVPPDTSTPLPTLPPPSPGAPPEPPELSVQAIVLEVASAPPPHPGGTALVQGTLTAQRGSDSYSVPHAVVTLSVTSAPGHGADVIPAELDSGDTGVILITVVTGDRPGDTVIHAQSGNAGADVTVTVNATATPTPSSAAPPVAAGSGGNPRDDSRGYLVASLAGLSVALVAGYVTAVVVGRMPNPFQRRAVWGRRSR